MAEGMRGGSSDWVVWRNLRRPWTLVEGTAGVRWSIFPASRAVECLCVFAMYGNDRDKAPSQ